MIVEAAFIKLPELLTSRFDHGDIFEAAVVHYLAHAIHMELDCRNITRPFNNVCTEKPYPCTRHFQADLYLEQSQALPISDRIQLYGIRAYNWVEVKVFFGSTRNTSTQVKTMNSGLIFRDLLRLCLFPGKQGTFGEIARYFVAVFSSQPSDSITLTYGKRPWLLQLLEDGTSEFCVDTTNEKSTFLRALGPGFVDSPSLSAKFTVHTLSFCPEFPGAKPVFWGYLNRIKAFSIAVPSAKISFEGKPNERWEQDKVKILEGIRNYVSQRMSKH